MAEIPMQFDEIEPNDQDDAREMLQDLLDLEEGLSDWEVNFIDSLDNWKGKFTPKQIEILEKIWKEKAR